MTSQEGEPFFNPMEQEESATGVTPPETENKKIQEAHEKTPERMRKSVDAAFNLVCKNFTVEGKEKLLGTKKDNPDATFIIASSHFSNLDAGAAVKALGDKFNIQITAESALFGFTGQEAMFRIAGKDSFTPLEYKKIPKTSKKDTGKKPIFNPKDFEVLSEQIEDGKTPWMALHPFTLEGKMQDARIGSVYLAHKTGAKIIPAALETHGEGGALISPKDLGKRLIGRLKGSANATYHIGEVIDLPELDVSIIEKVLKKRETGERISTEERKQFKETHEKLKEEADQIAHKIAEMLPKEQRGSYDE